MRSGSGDPMRHSVYVLFTALAVVPCGTAMAQYQGRLPPPYVREVPSPPLGMGYEDDAPTVYVNPNTNRPSAGYELPPRPPMGVSPGPQPYQAAPSVVPQSPPSRFSSLLPQEYQPETGAPKELPPRLRRQLVNYATREPVGTIVIDTANTYLYLVLGGGQALRYGIGVGREGFTWSGAERVSKMAEWPDWHPPAEMIERQPYLPRFMSGGEGNPLGARALYLGKTLYRIHGTNQPSTIGTFVSSGCIRLTNADIEDLYGRVQVGTRVVVLQSGKASENQPAQLPYGGLREPVRPGVLTR